MKKLFAILIVNLYYAQNIGINTQTPDPSAILELNADPIAGSVSSSKKGFLPPRISLLGTNDITTIPNPSNGLFVYNTLDAGSFPNQVSANSFYYWNGIHWEKLMPTSSVEKAVKPRIFYIQGNDTQTFTASDINSASGAAPSNLVTFTTPLINAGTAITFNAGNSTFTAAVSGIYEISAFVNYNPKATTSGVPTSSFQKRAYLNLMIQKSTDNGSTWTNTIGSRTAWGNDGGGELKTAILLGTPLQLNQGNQIRLVIINPFNSTSNNDHCGGGNCFIGADPSNNIPLSKGLQIQLLDFNIE
jgi:hypothetical protein